VRYSDSFNGGEAGSRFYFSGLIDDGNNGAGTVMLAFRDANNNVIKFVELTPPNQSPSTWTRYYSVVEVRKTFGFSDHNSSIPLASGSADINSSTIRVVWYNLNGPIQQKYYICNDATSAILAIQASSSGSHTGEWFRFRDFTFREINDGVLIADGTVTTLCYYR